MRAAYLRWDAPSWNIGRFKLLAFLIQASDEGPGVAAGPCARLPNCALNGFTEGHSDSHSQREVLAQRLVKIEGASVSAQAASISLGTPQYLACCRVDHHATDSELSSYFETHPYQH